VPAHRNTLDIVDRCIEVIQIGFQICLFSSFEFVAVGFVSRTYRNTYKLL